MDAKTFKKHFNDTVKTLNKNAQKSLKEGKKQAKEAKKVAAKKAKQVPSSKYVKQIKKSQLVKQAPFVKQRSDKKKTVLFVALGLAVLSAIGVAALLAKHPENCSCCGKKKNIHRSGEMVEKRRVTKDQVDALTEPNPVSVLDDDYDVPSRTLEESDLKDGVEEYQPTEDENR